MGYFHYELKVRFWEKMNESDYKKKNISRLCFKTESDVVAQTFLFDVSTDEVLTTE